MASFYGDLAQCVIKDEVVEIPPAENEVVSLADAILGSNINSTLAASKKGLTALKASFESSNGSKPIIYAAKSLNATKNVVLSSIQETSIQEMACGRTLLQLHIECQSGCNETTDCFLESESSTSDAVSCF